MQRVKPGFVHPLRAHCFAQSSANFTKEQLEGVRSLPVESVTYVYQMEKDPKDTIKRHRSCRSIKFDKPLAAGLLAKGMLAFSGSVCYDFSLIHLRRFLASEAGGCRVCSTVGWKRGRFKRRPAGFSVGGVRVPVIWFEFCAHVI